jgi:two-component system NtrC family sensor kinase
MLRFRNIAIQRKLTLIIMLTCIVAMLLAAIAFIVFEIYKFRQTMVQNLTTTARIIGANCTAALSFHDSASADQTLSALQAEPHVVWAAILDKDGKPFASYRRDANSVIDNHTDHLHTDPDGYHFEANHLELRQSIVLDHQTIGTVYVARDLREMRDRLLQYATIMVIVMLASSLVAYLLSSMLQKIISQPILDLAETAKSVSREKNYSLRAIKQSEDEIGALIDGFNEMLVLIQARDTALQAARDDLEKRVQERTRELETIHKQLVDASRRGGMAEIATNVLHNVGNVLNSVNVSTSVIAESVKTSKVSNLARVVVLLQEHAHDLGTFLTSDARGKHVPAHLAQLSEHLMADQAALVSELDSLRRNVEHIKEIVAMQQNYATFGGVKEKINVVNLVEDSLRMNTGALSRHRVEVIREFETVPPMNVEKHKVLQILVNLVRNAKHACQDSGCTDKRMTMRVANGDGRVRISVIDNGVGIAPDNLTRIFNHGFTTKKDGHGFGLHSGALAAKEMGGSLTVHSDGLGQGAAFTLELPCPTRENSHE